MEKDLCNFHHSWLVHIDLKKIYRLNHSLPHKFWELLSQNPNAMFFLERNIDKIDWNSLSSNPSAMHL